MKEIIRRQKEVHYTGGSNMRKYSVIFLILVLGILGCSPSIHMRPDFGVYTNLAFERQIINLDAPLDKAPVEGLPGSVAENIYKRHADSFKIPIPERLTEEGGGGTGIGLGAVGVR